MSDRVDDYHEARIKAQDVSMKRMGRMLFCVALALGASLASAADADTFTHKGAGLSIQKPADWSYVTAAQNADNANILNLGDEERRQALLKLANTSLFAITKFPEPYPDLNLSLRVSFRPFGNLKGKPMADVVSMVLPQMQRSMKDYSLVQAPTEVLVSGITSVYIRINHTLEVRGGPSFPATSEMWFIPRGDYFFLIGAGTRQDEKTGTRQEIQAILKTVNIDQWVAK